MPRRFPSLWRTFGGHPFAFLDAPVARKCRNPSSDAIVDCYRTGNVNVHGNFAPSAELASASITGFLIEHVVDCIVKFLLRAQLSGTDVRSQKLVSQTLELLFVLDTTGRATSHKWGGAPVMRSPSCCECGLRWTRGYSALPFEPTGREQEPASLSGIRTSRSS